MPLDPPGCVLARQAGYDATVSTRRTIAAIALAAVAPFALSACGTSFGAQTNQQYQAGIGANLRTGPVEVYNGLFVDNGDGTATFSGALLSTEDQTIESLTVNGQPKRLAKPISLRGGQLLTLGPNGLIVVKGDGIKAGFYATIDFAARPGGDVSVQVPIVERTSEYDSVAKRAGGSAAPTQEEQADPAEGDEGRSDQDQSDTSPPSQ